MPAHLPLHSQRLVVVTGKGGVGKSAVAAALARAAARAHRRVLAVEIGAGRLGALLGAGRLGLEPRTVATGTGRRGRRARGCARGVRPPDPAAAHAEPAPAREHQLPGGGRRRARTAGVPRPAAAEYMDRGAPPRAARVRPDRRRRSGVRALASPARRAADARRPRPPRARRRHAAHASAHGSPTRRRRSSAWSPRPRSSRSARPSSCTASWRAASGCPSRPPSSTPFRRPHFTRTDEAAIARLEASGERHPHVAAARFLLERRREAAAQVRALRRALGAAPVRLPFLFAGPEADGGIDALARELAQAARLAA